MQGFEREWPRPRYPCPTCFQSLVLRWGDHRRPHFAHLPNSTSSHCSGGGEGIVHKAAKELLTRYLNMGRCVGIDSTCHQCSRTYRTTIRCTSGEIAAQEHPISSHAHADVCIIDESTRDARYVIEILKTHRTRTASRDGYDWVELSADDILRKFKDKTLDAMPPQIVLTCQRGDRQPCRKDDTCLHPHAFARQLGLLSDDYPNEECREIDIAIRGYRRSYWELPEDSMDTNAPSFQMQWQAFTARKQCIKCGTREPRASRYRPYCIHCYREISRDGTEHRETVSAETKRQLRLKYAWLNSVPIMTGQPGCDPCIGCNEPPPPNVNHGVWWFGTKRNLCSNCLHALSVHTPADRRDQLSSWQTAYHRKWGTTRTVAEKQHTGFMCVEV